MNLDINLDANRPIPESHNRDTGFYGFMSEIAPQTWALAILAVANATDGSLEHARMFLDSPLGWSFAEAIYLSMSDEVDACEAIRQVMPRWFKDPR